MLRNIIVFSLFLFFILSATSGNFIPDVRFAGIELENKQSVVKTLGDLTFRKQADTLRRFSGVLFYDTAQRQYIRVIQFPGSGDNFISQIEVGYIQSLHSPGNSYFFQGLKFVSATGVRLGQTEFVIQQLKGTHFKRIHENDLDVFVYSITDAKSPFLKAHNQPAYEARFYFKNGKLVRYVFGFVYG